MDCRVANSICVLDARSMTIKMPPDVAKCSLDGKTTPSENHCCRKFLSGPFQSCPPSPTLLHPEITYFLISASMFSPVLELHINESTWYVLFCVWHLLFNIMSMKFAFITVHIRSITSICYGLSVLLLINIWVVSCLL